MPISRECSRRRRRPRSCWGAIARSDGTRASVLAELRATKVTDGILGTFRFDGNGDITPGWVPIVRITRPAETQAWELEGAAPVRAERLPPSAAD